MLQMTAVLESNPGCCPEDQALIVCSLPGRATGAPLAVLVLNLRALIFTGEALFLSRVPLFYPKSPSFSTKEYLIETCLVYPDKNPLFNQSFKLFPPRNTYYYQMSYLPPREALLTRDLF